MIFDADQKRAVAAISRGAHTLLLGPGGSGKTMVVRETLKGTSFVCAAVSSKVASRFDNLGVNTMQLIEVAKRHGTGNPHPLVDTNIHLAALFGEKKGAFTRGEPWTIAIDEVGQMSAEHWEQVLKAVWGLFKRVHGAQAYAKFNRGNFVLMGDCERQLPPVEGRCILESRVFVKHPSGFERKFELIELTGTHRYNADTREFVAMIEDAFKKGDRDFLNKLLRRQQREYERQSAAHGNSLDGYPTFCASRAEVETYLTGAADRLFGSDVEQHTTRPPETMDTKEATSSAYHAATYIFPPDHDLVLEATVSGAGVVAESIADGTKHAVMNRQRFYVGPGAFTSVPEFFPVRKSQTPPELLVHFGEPASDCSIGMYHYPQKKTGGACSKPIFRAIGWKNCETRTWAAKAEIMYNAQGKQHPGPIVFGCDTSATPIGVQMFYVALTRTPDPTNVLFHPKIPGINFADIGRRKEVRAMVDRLKRPTPQTPQPELAMPPRRRHSSWSLPPAKKKALSFPPP